LREADNAGIYSVFVSYLSNPVTHVTNPSPPNARPPQQMGPGAFKRQRGPVSTLRNFCDVQMLTDPARA
jgi:hypothetical protein